MLEICRNHLKVFVSLLLFMFVTLLLQQTTAHAGSTSRSVSYVSYNCEDFGTKERAQSEFNRFSFDKYGLDGDGDGQVCEWNPSTGNWGWITAGSGLILGRYFGKKKRFGADEVVPLPKGLFFDLVDKGDGKRTVQFEGITVGLPVVLWWVPYFVMTILRDRVYPISTPPAGLIATCLVLGFGLTYWAASTRDNWI
jgi:hypothetical protein